MYSNFFTQFLLEESSQRNYQVTWDYITLRDYEVLCLSGNSAMALNKKTIMTATHKG